MERHSKNALFLTMLVLASLGSISLFAQRENRGESVAVDSSGPVVFESILDAVRRWTPDRQLYLRGRIGVGDRQLAELQSWLSKNGPHWTIVLMENANGEFYKTSDGRIYTGMDAVEHALGHELNNGNDFGSLVHPITREPDGTIFVLFLQERKFSYFSSTAQNRRNLGENQWIGHLDQPAFRAMRHGGRILDAVKETVTSINQQLERAIKAESDAAQLAELERKRAKETLTASLFLLSESIAKIEGLSKSLVGSDSQAKGPLAQPPIDRWRQSLKQIEAELPIENVHKLEQMRMKTSNEVDLYLNAYAARSGFSDQVTQLRESVRKLKKEQLEALVPTILLLEGQIEQAQKGMRNGDLELASYFQEGERLYAEGEKLILQEREKIRLADLRRTWIGRTILFTLGMVSIVLAIFLAFLNFRRLPAKRKALAALEEREESVAKETEEADRLFERNADILGSKERIEQRGYIGKTRDIGIKAFEFGDDLMLMSKEIRRVLREARDLIEPRGLWGKLINLFSSHRYEQGINHVTGKPLRFSQATGLPSILADSLQTRTVVKGQEGQGVEIQLTFEEVFAAFQKRGDDATNALKTIEDALASIQDAMASTTDRLHSLMERERRLNGLSKEDGYFHLPALFESLLPSIQQDLDESDSQAAFDAVQAIQVAIPRADRKLSEVHRLADMIDRARSDLFPKLKERAEQLLHSGYQSDWIDSELDAISASANQAIAASVERSIESEIGTISASIANLEAQANLATELVSRIQHRIEPEWNRVRSKIAEARRDLMGALKLSESEVLRELDRDPDDHLERARQNIQAGQTLLTQGKMDASESSLECAEKELSSAQQIIDASIAGARDFESRMRETEQRRDQLMLKGKGIRFDLEGLQSRYESSSFQLLTEAEPPFHLSADQIAEDAIEKCRGSVQNLKDAEKSFRVGEILEALSVLHQANLDLAKVEANFAMVSNHLAELERQASENASSYARCLDLGRELESAKSDPLVTRKTLQDIRQILTLLDEAKEAVNHDQRLPNPFETRKRMSELESNLQRLQASILGDHQGHAEATRAWNGAVRQMEVARASMRQSQTDNIPDSPKTVQANARIASFDRELREIQQSLQEEHGDWQAIDRRASELQSALSEASAALESELASASRAWQAFQSASQSVFQAEQWSGPWGLRIQGSPGVRELERCRNGLQSGNYDAVLDLSRLAMTAAAAAIQQMEREVIRRQTEERREEERQRRAREAASQPTWETRPFGGKTSSLGGSFGRNPPPSPPSSSGNSGFSRSGW